jgi:CyaY protein
MERQSLMTESEFTQLADTIFSRIENALDNTDIDCNLNGGVMEIELEDESKIIINRHTPNREMWIAAKSGGFHYHLLDGQWLNTRDGSEFFSKLSELSGMPV